MAAPAGGRPRRDQAANSALLSLPEPILVHILLQLVDKSGLYARADALSALSFMLTCKQVAHLVASSDEVWAAMLRAELFAPEEAGKLHSARARFLQLRSLSLSGFWRVVGHYATGEEYTYRMQLCDVSNSHVWAEEEEGAADDPWAAELGVGLQFHFGIAGLPNVPRRDAQRCDWVIGDVAGPWRMRILAKCTNNMIIFNECATDEHNGNWVNICSAVISADGTRMEGMWMQTRERHVIVSQATSGTFEAVLEERPPAGVPHMEWYYKAREEEKRAWEGRTTEAGPAEADGGLDDEALEAPALIPPADQPPA